MKPLWKAISISLALVMQVTFVSAAIRTVNPKDSMAIQTAINVSAPYDTIQLQDAVYEEYDVNIDKPLTLIGTGQSTIDGINRSKLITVTADHVTITGITFVNTPVSFVKENAAVLLEGVDACRITGNTFRDNFFAIYAANSENCTIADNHITGSAESVTLAGNAIHLWYCRDMTVNDNTVSGHRDGIYFEYVRSSTIQRNSVFENLRYGLHFMFSDSCVYTHNRFVRNGAGVAVMYTHEILMQENLFKDNWGAATYGLLLKDITDCSIIANHIDNNSIGIHLDGSDDVVIKNNRLTNNGWAVKILSNCLNNEIVDNDFIDNSFQVATNSRNTKSLLSGNYWSSYKGFDLDRDGYGDLGYRPVSLYSILVEANPPTLVLLRSLVIDVLNLAERVIPTLTPQTLSDPKPRMRPAL